MRRIIVSTLFLSTALLTAQSSTNGQGATLEARSEAPHALLAAAAPAQPVTDAGEAPKQLRVSTGVTEPKLIKYHPIQLSTADFHRKDVGSQKLVLHFLVDEKGTPQNIEVVKSVNQDVDSRMLSVVREFRYAPAMLDGQVVSSDLNLVVNFETR